MSTTTKDAHPKEQPLLFRSSLVDNPKSFQYAHINPYLPILVRKRLRWPVEHMSGDLTQQKPS